MFNKLFLGISIRKGKYHNFNAIYHFAKSSQEERLTTYRDLKL